MYTLTIDTPQRTYPLYIQKGLFPKLGQEIKKLYTGKKIAIITDTNVDRLHGKALESLLKAQNYETHKIIIPPGEKSKSLSMLEKVYTDLINCGLNRDNLIIAFGGGVVGDLAGFAASTYLRGVSYVQIPTTLLAQIDSSVGGKVAVNLERGKNLVGSFYHPLAVFIDPELLITLEERYFYDGMAEVIKYGAIRDKALFDRLLGFHSDEALFMHIEEIIYICCSIKKEIVEKDERDIGDRLLLNFGHTIGHAIEKYFNYEKFTHGEAVAIGMFTITQNSERLGFTEGGTAALLHKILSRYNLPSRLPINDNRQLLHTIKGDKKSSDDFIKIVLLRHIGNPQILKVENDKIAEYI